MAPMIGCPSLEVWLLHGVSCTPSLTTGSTIPVDVSSTPGPRLSGAGHTTADAGGAAVVVGTGAAVVSGAETVVDVVLDAGAEDAPAIVDGSSLEHATSASNATSVTHPELRRQTAPEGRLASNIRKVWRIRGWRRCRP